MSKEVTPIVVAMSNTQYFGKEKISSWTYAYMLRECMLQMGTLYHANPMLEIPTGMQVVGHNNDGWVCLVMFAHSEPHPLSYEVTHRRFSNWFDLMNPKKPNERHHAFALTCEMFAHDLGMAPPMEIAKFIVFEKIEHLDHQFRILGLKLEGDVTNGVTERGEE